ncbi:hypothetical protein EXW72_08185 [Pseudomonas sp. BCA14]|uniref:hypothetical protein n=1 Tax=unclassified Pseudomonas TaxID=196821 RepID=UPI00106E09BC|nr:MULTISPECIES: hypothetical protein [unclassified Pseudomonas]TFF13753.1 hypothetical protein EXW70_04305 [Pseudomonas sp. JMN1]TFF15564.1 hypothetical protein EXW71_04735 [Pseudomonas sp. BCA17]TFF31971.1 hypothetical protein EXW72_08185 [Pseudomonas sp. BCA14]TFF32924.1 hypothetical protein EXW73_03985 [Pseudomonas sp. BCA13]
MTINIERANAVQAWFALRGDPAFISTTPEDRYEIRLALADDLKAYGAIDGKEWQELVEEAAAGYSDEVG